MTSRRLLTIASAILLLTACSRPANDDSSEPRPEPLPTVPVEPEVQERRDPEDTSTETGRADAEASTVDSSSLASTNEDTSVAEAPGAETLSASDEAKAALRKARMERPLDFDRLERAIYDKYQLHQLADPLAEFAAIQQRAEEGDADALFDLGLLLAHADSDIADPELAAALFTRAAESGIGRANAELGRLYLTGNGVPVDFARAEQLFAESWQAGDPEGAFLLASTYRLGLLGEEHPERARSLLTAAAERGHVAAARALYALSEDGEIEDADSHIGAWLQAAAESGDVGAMLDLAAFNYRRGNMDAAFAALETAADAGSSGAAVRLLGTSLPALNNPEVRARFMDMLELHTDGSGPAAIKSFELLALAQLAEPDRDLATQRAREYFQEAADLGSQRAKVTVALLDRGTILPEAIIEARKLSEEEAYVRSIELGREAESAAPASRPARPVSVVRTQYPAELRAENLAGAVIVELVVQTDGTVTDVRATETTHPAFAQAAEAAVSQWKFDPGLRNGSPVATKMRVPIHFEAEK